MTPTFRAAGTTAFTANNVANPSSLSPGAPAGVAVGDLLLLICTSRSNSATISTPSGWTLVSGAPWRSGTASGGTIYVFSRIADGTGSDTPSPSWSGLTTGTSGDSSDATIIAVQNADDTLDVAAVSSDLSAQGSTTTVPAVTTASPMSYVVGATIKILESSGQTSTVSGRTERVDQSTTSGTGHIVEVCDVVKQAPGATAACTITWSATTSARALSVSLAFLAVMPTPTDTGLTVSEAGPDSNVIRAVTDTGLTASDSIAAQKIFGRVATDTGLTVSDSLASRRCPAISDTGLTVTDSLVDQEVFARTLTVTGLTVTDSPAATTLRARTISDTLTITDGGVVFPGAHFNVTAADYGLGPPPIVFGPLG